MVEVGGGLPECGPLKGCAQVAPANTAASAACPSPSTAWSSRSFCSTCALAWWRTDLYGLLLVHYGLSLAGVLFEAYFLYVQVFVIGAVCVWCTSYGLSLVLRFVIAFVIWIRQPPPDGATLSA